MKVLRDRLGLDELWTLAQAVFCADWLPGPCGAARQTHGHWRGSRWGHASLTAARFREGRPRKGTGRPEQAIIPKGAPSSEENAGEGRYCEGIRREGPH